MMPKPPFAVMDAQCALCSFGARMIHRIDKAGLIRIVPIQTPLGREILIKHELDPDDPSTWLYVNDAGASAGFDGMIALGQDAGGWGRALGAMRLFPRPLRGWLYDFVARNRYRVFGKGDLCALPDPALQARIIR